MYRNCSSHLCSETQMWLVHNSDQLYQFTVVSNTCDQLLGNMTKANSVIISALVACVLISLLCISAPFIKRQIPSSPQEIRSQFASNMTTVSSNFSQDSAAKVVEKRKNITSLPGNVKESKDQRKSWWKTSSGNLKQLVS